MLTTPPDVILRILRLFASDTYRFPAESIVIPIGLLKLAAVPVSSAEPSEPLPANVLTTPKDVILRILLLPESAIYRFPNESIAIPDGPLKLAYVPVPSVYSHEPLPANMLTLPSGVILRIILLPVSATYRFPAESTVIPYGL